jgi:pSer/pThr/pTyr-binding forkhead associated (FHA) protein
MFHIVIGQNDVAATMESVVRKPEVIIGRAPGSDILLKRGSVSWRHCRLFRINEYAIVEDLGSSNGTWVNGERISGPHALDAKDEIRIGDYTLYVSVPEEMYSAPKRSAKRGKTATGPRGPRTLAGATPSPFAVLGVPADASYAEAQRAYKRLVSQYHPDRVAQAAPELQQLAEVRSKQIQAAWLALERKFRRGR